jgi:uncharacterized protein YigE (DUF2233 family)
MFLLSARFWALVIFLAGLGFAGVSLATRLPYSPWYVARWESLGEGMERMEFVSAEDTNVLLYRFSPTAYRVGVEVSSEPKRLKSWAAELEGETLVMNGFYFLEDNTPAGLLIADGQPLHAQEFDADKSGVIRLDPDFAILDTDEETFSDTGVLAAGQSYPFLLKHGQLSIQEDSGLVARRTFLGTDQDGLIYAGIVWKDHVSLFDLAGVLQEIEVSWDHVLNLDGGPSTGLSVELTSFGEAFDSALPVPNVIVVERKNE